MTVTYTYEVASSRGFGCFWKLLFRWRGSIYKLIWPDLLFYSIVYALLSVMYRVLLSEPHRRVFEKVCITCQQFTDLIPVSFVLGFYVSIVVARWWNQWLAIPWPHTLALFVSTSIVGLNDRSRLMRRTIMRYVNLTFVITLTMIAPSVKKRFPTLDHVLEAGLITASEKKIFDDLDRKTSHPKYWMPLVWAGAIVGTARKERKIRDDFAVKTILDEISKFRSGCGELLGYDWISIPLVYTQVVTLAVYTYFLGTLMGSQFLDPAQDISGKNVDFYVPIFTLLQFFFYMGWLKVAETLVNPFGDDDDDFEVNGLIDSYFQISYLIVDEMHEEHPDLIPDIYWDEVFPHELPYTVASEPFRTKAPQGSTFNMELPEEEMEILVPVTEEDESDDAAVKIDIKASQSSALSLDSIGSGLAMKDRAPVNRKESYLSNLKQKLTMGKDNSFGSNVSVRRKAVSVRANSRMSGNSIHTSKSRESISRNLTHTSLAAKGSPKNRHRRETSGSSVSGEQESKPFLTEVPPPPPPEPVDTNADNITKEFSVEPDGTIVIKLKPPTSSGFETTVTDDLTTPLTPEPLPYVEDDILQIIEEPEDLEDPSTETDKK